MVLEPDVVEYSLPWRHTNMNKNAPETSKCAGESEESDLNGQKKQAPMERFKSSSMNEADRMLSGMPRIQKRTNNNDVFLK